jgi:hypothetical protein
MKEIITDSIRYWEPRRIVFNVLLALVVAGSFFCHQQPSISQLTWQPVLGLLLAAVLANVLYCAAYIADIFLQMSEYRPVWRRYRWALCAIGTAFAAGIFLLHE